MPWIAELALCLPLHPRRFLDFLISLLYQPLSSLAYRVGRVRNALDGGVSALSALTPEKVLGFLDKFVVPAFVF